MGNQQCIHDKSSFRGTSDAIEEYSQSLWPPSDEVNPLAGISSGDPRRPAGTTSAMRSRPCGSSMNCARVQIRVLQRLHDGNGNWDHLNLIFPVYLKLMTGFPSFHQEDVGAEFLN
jgi:hypothetical protein